MAQLMAVLRVAAMADQTADPTGGRWVALWAGKWEPSSVVTMDDMSAGKSVRLEVEN
jgi:hypothetical protein